MYIVFFIFLKVYSFTVLLLFIFDVVVIDVVVTVVISIITGEQKIIGKALYLRFNHHILCSPWYVTILEKRVLVAQ